MLLKNIGKLESAKFYVDASIRVGNEQALKAKKKGERLAVEKKFESCKIVACQTNLAKRLGSIIDSFPKLEKLPEFYAELVKITIDVDATRQSLRGLSSFAKSSRELARNYADKIKKSTAHQYIEGGKKAFYGRLHSDARKLDKYLRQLDDARRVMKDYPTVKTGIPTVVIIGFPNVGKTTLLYRLTGSKPEIQNYSFTTKNLNVSYLTVGGKRIQLLDTPGSLNRVDKMNPMEKQAYLAVKVLASCIVYVFDPTESYPLSQQVKLYESLQALEKPLLVYVSKTDLSTERVHELKRYDPIISIEELKERISQLTSDDEAPAV